VDRQQDAGVVRDPTPQRVIDSGVELWRADAQFTPPGVANDDLDGKASVRLFGNQRTALEPGPSSFGIHAE